MLEKLDFYLPEKLLTNDMLANEFEDFSSDKILKKIGIHSRHIVPEGETALDLAFHAAEKVLKNYKRSNIDYLLLCTQSPEYHLPASACILQDRLGLEKKIGALDFNQGCSGFVYGLSLVKGLLSLSSVNSVLLITAETYSRYLAPDDKGNRSIFGDGAAAFIVDNECPFSIGEFVFGTDGSGAQNLIVEGGGARSRMLFLRDSQNKLNDYLSMNGPEIFNFTIEVIPDLIHETAARNSLDINDINHFVFHQANKYMLSYLRDKLSLDKKRFHIDMAETGNTVSASIPILLKKLINESVFQSGDKILLAGFGVGYSYSAVVLEYKS